MSTAYVGTSGYQYDHWQGIIYTHGLPKDRWFARYTESFDAVAINHTFNGLPEPETVE